MKKSLFLIITLVFNLSLIYSSDNQDQSDFGDQTFCMFDNGYCSGNESCCPMLGCIEDNMCGSCMPYCPDADGDGYSPYDQDSAPDCDDNNANIHPNANEVCDGIDNNCAGGTDEAVFGVVMMMMVMAM